jgi:putative effector of murein hydrolase LrgA (UPF0299 family)
MRELFIWGIYLLIPIFSALCIKRFDQSKVATYLITILLFLLLPYLVVQINNYYSPPAPGPRCDIGQQVFFVAGYLIMLPLGILYQFFVNLFVFEKH